MWTSLWLGLALAGEPSTADLQEGSALAWQVVGHCRAQPEACRALPTRQRLARAFYTLVLDDLVHGRPADPVASANVRLLSDDLWRRLPPLAQREIPEPAPWVVALTETPSPQPRPAVQQQPESPGPLPPVNVESLPPAQQVTALWSNRHQPGIGPKLTEALQRAGMPAAALTVVLDSTDATWPVQERASLAIALSGALGSHRLLLDWIEDHPPERWGQTERSIGWLLSGIAHQQQGQYSPALKAYAALETGDPGWLQAQFQRGLIAWQTGDPWSALRAFRNAAEAELHLPDDAGVREQAMWHAALVYQELGRTSDAISTWEVLTIRTGALADRAALRCAWATHELGEQHASKQWMPPWPAEGIYRPERDLLLAQWRLEARDHVGAQNLLDRTRADIALIDGRLGELLDDLGDLWSRLERTEDEVLAQRLDLNAQLVAWRASLRTLDHEREPLESMDAGRARTELSQRLDRLASEIRARATTAAYYEVSGLRRQLDQLDRSAEQQRKRLTVP